MTDLGVLPGDASSAGLALNDNGDIVGVSLDKNFNLRAFLRTNGEMHDLNDLVPASTSLYFILACSINSSGEIVGQAVDKVTGEAHGYLLTPDHSASGSISPALREVAVPNVSRPLTSSRYSSWAQGSRH